MSTEKAWGVWAVKLSPPGNKEVKTTICRVARDIPSRDEADATAEFLTATVAMHRTEVVYEAREQVD